MGVQVALTVNGEAVTRVVEPNPLLVRFSRDTLRLTGTHAGGDSSQCGACTVRIGGRAVKRCGLLAVQAAGRQVGTIEGLAAPAGTLHPKRA
ncbi:MAG: (2Fe-2S)-binding protein, partial [Microbacteriaceae bacterium]|nr:(2Fe-2S)-binding protein [Burkholderiaceae bacterium]